MEIIDIGKLKMANESLKLIDSGYFTLPVLRDRYEIEVLRANSAVTTDVAAEFRDSYLDREVAWANVMLVDTGVKGQKKYFKGKGTYDRDLYRKAEERYYEAISKCPAYINAYFNLLNDYVDLDEFDNYFKVISLFTANLRIPGQGDRNSEVIPIRIPKLI